MSQPEKELASTVSPSMRTATHASLSPSGGWARRSFRTIGSLNDQGLAVAVGGGDED